MNCGSTDPCPRHRVFKLFFLVVFLAVAAVSSYYFYQRAKELDKAEDRAKAVVERVYELPSAQTPLPVDGGMPEK